MTDPNTDRSVLKSKVIIIWTILLFNWEKDVVPSFQV